MSDRNAFSFDEIVDRRDSNSLKWNAAKVLLTSSQAEATPLPMWLADMDFKAPPPVLDALTDAVEHGVFGYPTGATKSYLEAVTRWQHTRFGWDVDPEWVLPVSGVITALKTIIQACSAPGDSVLIQPPVYVHFHNDVLINGRHLARAPLKFDGKRYEFDAAAFKAAVREDTKLFILSNPHNPTGNVWTADELRTMGEICFEHGVLVISDEIHQDFVLNPEKRHIPFASLGPQFASNSITCASASKTFNLAGLQCANMFIPNPRLRSEIGRQIDRNLMNKVNVLGMVATEAAYAQGESWLEALLAYVRANHRHFADQVNTSGLGLNVLDMESLYLAWIDCRSLAKSGDLDDALLKQGRVWFDKGLKFGVEGEGFVRANLGCPRSVVDEAIQRLRYGLAGKSGGVHRLSSV
ncbi:MalY/PatB family protein [Acidovorax sp. MR-S7]|uniref:MalY/PatB family protein n=1 Tax=Acidovorax sp. MR-S7 TaxID=1268622 RepID=UPI00039F88EC|nr:MalY/PatB family protein [Acidovorax sp. MR-S7]